MGRGFFLGMFSGTFVSAIAVATASLMAPQPAGNAPPERPQVEAPEAASGDVTPGTAPATVEAMEDGPTLGVAPTVDTPSAETDAPLADTTPADVPETGAIDTDLGTPDTGGETPLVDLDSTVEPVLPTPQSVAPEVPQIEDDITLSTEPAQPVAPVVVDDSAFADPAVAEVVEPEAEADPEAEAGPAPEADPEVDPASDTEPAPDTEAEEFVIIDLGDDAPVIADDSPDTGETFAPEPAPTFQLQGDAGALPTVDDSGVIIRRPGTDETEVAAEQPEVGSGPALERFAATHENPEGKPLLSIILMDDDTMPGASAALAGLPFPVTIALDPSVAGAAEKMAAYRAAGLEVAALVNLPRGAAPSDVEIAFAAYFAALPEAVLVLDGGEGGLQSDVAVTRQAMEILAADGRALVTVSRGLNQAVREAERAQVPAAVVYRDLDSEGQDAQVIRRFLDQAAFQARKESGVMLLGRLRPDTISALILWGTANRAGQVSVAPASAVLMAQ
ncbi:divergent polysaccharide deacetylase family protein [Octadecabacter sp. R77987]|uniref:divergent polysaccharide deacetylase family protein n=1 Tax=Octadecabacter sp. R77987 TaxID=3093874 RepID=UPI00366BC713